MVSSTGDVTILDQVIAAETLPLHASQDLINCMVRVTQGAWVRATRIAPSSAKVSGRRRPSQCSATASSWNGQGSTIPLVGSPSTRVTVSVVSPLGVGTCENNFLGSRPKQRASERASQV